MMVIAFERNCRERMRFVKSKLTIGNYFNLHFRIHFYLHRPMVQSQVLLKVYGPRLRDHGVGMSPYFQTGLTDNQGGTIACSAVDNNGELHDAGSLQFRCEHGCHLVQYRYHALRAGKLHW